MRPRQKDKQEWNNVSFKNNLKIFKMKKEIEEIKTELFSYNSYFSHTKTSILADLKYIIIVLISLLFHEMKHLKVD